MSDPGPFPGSVDEETGPPSEPGSRRRLTALLVAIVVVVVLAMIVLHFTGVLGPGLH